MEDNLFLFLLFNILFIFGCFEKSNNIQQFLLTNDNVHQYDINTIDEQRLPRFWIKSLDELEMTLS